MTTNIFITIGLITATVMIFFLIRLLSNYRKKPFGSVPETAEQAERTFHAHTTGICNQIDAIENVAHYINAMSAIKAFQDKYRQLYPFFKVQDETAKMIAKIEEKEALVMKPIIKGVAKLPSRLSVAK